MVVATACSWLAVGEKAGEEQREVMEGIEKAGGMYDYDYPSIRLAMGYQVRHRQGQRGSASCLGDDLFVNGRGINFYPLTNASDAEVERLKERPNSERFGWATPRSATPGCNTSKI